MKSTEAIDESVESSGPVLAAAESAGAADPSMLDQRRRRLVRGAAALAPLVLTLRSGALAAASCTGVKVGVADTTPSTNDKPGWIVMDKNATPIAKVQGLQEGDVCVDTGILQTCDGNNPGKVFVPSSSSFNEITTELVVKRNHPTQANKRYFACGTTTGWEGKDNIAILSAASCKSLNGGQECT
jgi:hypothetical protein